MRLVTAPPKSAQLADIIAARIESGKIRPGERLGSVRDIAAKFDVGRQVALSAFEILERRRLVRGEVGRGTFVLPRPGAAAKRLRLGFFVNDENLSKISNSVSFFHAAKRAGELRHDMILRTVMDKAPASQWANDNSLDGVLLGGVVTDRLVSEIEKTGVPFVVLGNYELSKNAPRVEIDFSPMSDAVGKAVEKFSCESVGAVGPGRSLLISRQLEAQVRIGAEKAGRRVFRELFRFTEAEDGHKEMAWLMEKAKVRPDFLYVTSQAFAGVAKYIFEKGLERGDRPRLMMITTPGEPPPYPELLDVTMDGRADFAEKGVELLAALAEGRATERTIVLKSCEKTHFAR